MSQRLSEDPMVGRITRSADLNANGAPVMFSESVLLGHYRMSYFAMRDAASETPDIKPTITVPHKSPIGMFEAAPGHGPGSHTHDYVETFVPLTDHSRFCCGLDGEDPDDLRGDVLLGPWDALSFSPEVWRPFDNASDEHGGGQALGARPAKTQDHRGRRRRNRLRGQAYQGCVISAVERDG